MRNLFRFQGGFIGETQGGKKDIKKSGVDNKNNGITNHEGADMPEKPATDGITVEKISPTDFLRELKNYNATKNSDNPSIVDESVVHHVEVPESLQLTDELISDELNQLRKKAQERGSGTQPSETE